MTGGVTGVGREAPGVRGAGGPVGEAFLVGGHGTVSCCRDTCGTSCSKFPPGSALWELVSPMEFNGL